MSDETYRPQRKPIQPSDLNEGGLNVKGNIPPQFAEAMNKKSDGQADTGQAEQNTSPKQASQKAMVRNAAIAPGAAQDPRVQEMLAHLQESSSIYEEIKLPSLGRFYDGSNGPQNGVIHVRPMTGEEEQILATPRFVRKGQAINMIFNRCVQECSQGQFDAEDLLTQDRTYLLIYLRGVSYTTEYDVEVTCPFTQSKFAYTIDLNELFVDYCPNDFDEESLVGKLSKSGYSYSYRLANGRDEKAVQQYREQKNKNFDTTNQSDDTILYRTATLLKDINGVDNFTDLRTILKYLPVSDLSELRTVVNEPPFGVETKISIQSPFTMEEFEIELPLEANFFFPRGKKISTPAK